MARRISAEVGMVRLPWTQRSLGDTMCRAGSAKTARTWPLELGSLHPCQAPSETTQTGGAILVGEDGT